MLDALDALDAFGRVELGHTPTALESTPRLGELLGVNLFVKRDDCTGLALGGNKVRQLEYYLGEAVQAHADVVLITGAIQSNFVRAAAAAARRLGMDIHIQLEDRVPGADGPYYHSGNVLLDHLLGAHIHRYANGEDEAGADQQLDTIADELRQAGKRPYVVHLGIDAAPIGALGYVRAGFELAQQFAQMKWTPDTVVVPSGSGLTHAGLLVGLRAAGVKARVHGICVRRGADAQLARIRQRTREVANLVNYEGIKEGDVTVSDLTLAPGYGRLNPETLDMLRQAAHCEGLILDPVYSAKTLAGLKALVTSGEILTGAQTLFVHTGGQPALFGYQSALTEALARD
ncbi:MAG: D-cysteine desulfhydrase family pyridoxal phosphate-dependent enzyme [Gammaproteobacteria bacterium]|jgi:D-cysteine desulfhydrase family pyridoxal phosphate-dependent enzyme